MITATNGTQTFHNLSEGRIACLWVNTSD